MNRVINRIAETVRKTKHPLIIQLMFVLVTLTIMAVFSGVVMAGTLNSKLLQSANSTIGSSASMISKMLIEPEVTLNFIADAIEYKLRRGEDFEVIKDYMRHCSSPTFKENIRLFNYYSVYGYFDVFENEKGFDLDAFFDGGGWIPHEHFFPKKRPYYAAAVEAGGDVIISDPYIDADSGTPVMAYARALYDTAGGLLGVVCLDVPMDYISEIVAGEQITEGGYGMLWDKDMQVLIHPNADMIGIHLQESSNDISRFAASVTSGDGISLESFTNYAGVNSILFGKRLDNGWYLALSVPRSEYYSVLTRTLIVMGVMSAFLAAGLIVILVRINKAKDESDKAVHETEEQKKRLEAIAQKEQEANQLKTRFLATMSHELRTPMNAILGIAEISLRNNNLTPETEQALGHIYESGSLLLSIINDILDLSKIEAGKLEIMPVRYSLPSLINDTVRLHRLRYDNKPIKFTLDVDKNTPYNMFGDDVRIKQILNNILSNAFKYTEKGEITMSVWAQPAMPEAGGDEFENRSATPSQFSELSEDEVTLVLEISDTGHGMTREQISRLFTDYTRFTSIDKRTISGTGLGLSITKHLTELMGGEIFIESEVGKGSVFTVRLPQRRTDASICGSRIAEKLNNFHFKSTLSYNSNWVDFEPMPYGSVLVVDDVESNLYVAKGMLQPYELKTDFVSCGSDAIEKVNGGNVYDIVFMDYMMPKMTGIEAAKALRETGYTGTIIALTADALVGQAEYFMNCGFDGYLSKPINSRILHAILCEFIRDKKPPEVVEAARSKKDIPAAQPPVTPSVSLEKLFIEDARDCAKTLTELMPKESLGSTLSDENLELYEIAVHGMKSAFLNVGDREHSQFAANLEMAAKKRDFALISKETPVFLDILEDAILKVS